MPTIKIRPAGIEESRTIGAFFQEAAEGVADYIWSTMIEDGENLLDVAERRFARTGTPFSYENALIAELDGEPVGMTFGFPMHVDPDEEACDDPVLAPYSELEQDNSYYLAGFLVRDSYRNFGIGSQLMAAFEAKARSEGYDQVSLIVFEANQDGLRLYRRMGFREVNRTPIVPHPLIHVTGDALLVVKKLATERAA